MNIRKPLSTREWYDFLAQMGDVLPGIHQGGLLATQVLLTMSDLSSQSRILDVGCGFGSTACLIASQYGAHVTGIDLAPAMIEKAVKKAARQDLGNAVDFLVADVNQMPFEDAVFDRIFLESVLTPLPGDKAAALREIIRVLEPGGLICINEGTLDTAASPELGNLMAKHPGIHGTFTADTLRLLLERAGLCVIKIVQEKTETGAEKPRIHAGALLQFMVKVYPKILLQMLRDRRLRQVSKIDDAVTRQLKKYAGCTLVVAQK